MTKTLAFVCVALALGISACGDTPSRSATEPAKGVDPARFSGHWTLDRQNSDDVRARFLPLFERDDKRWVHNAEKFEEVLPRESDRSGPPDEGQSNIHWMHRERQKEASALLTFATPATQLDIKASAHEVRIANNKGEGTRVLVPGESAALFVGVGGFKVASAWEKTGLTIDSRGEGENKIRVIEQYQLLADGNQLEERLDIRFPNMKRQQFRIVYNRS